MTRCYSSQIRAIGAMAVLCLMPGASFASAIGAKSVPKVVGNFGNPAVAPFNSNPHGASYAEWSARFWMWQFSMPVHANPIFDTADCSEGQSGKVWFLGGSGIAFETEPGVFTAKATRTCRIPPGTALFLPIVNSECSTIPGDQLPGYTNVVGDLEPCAKFASSFIVPGTLKATLDGVPIQALTQYKVTSPLFTFGPLPANNVLASFGLNAPAGTVAESVSDGIHLMLHPLYRGDHVLHFYAELDLSPIGGVTFIQDITYYLRVGR